MARQSLHSEMTAVAIDPPPSVMLVCAGFNPEITDLLVEGAHATLDEAGARTEIVNVPGALEIPPAISLVSSDQFEGFVALGCVIRGQTTHYETVATESARGLTHLGLSGYCIGNGILTVETQEQALERADPSRLNAGGRAAVAALSLICISRIYRKQDRS